MLNLHRIGSLLQRLKGNRVRIPNSPAAVSCRYKWLYTKPLVNLPDKDKKTRESVLFGNSKPGRRADLTASQKTCHALTINP